MTEERPCVVWCPECGYTDMKEMASKNYDTDNSFKWKCNHCNKIFEIRHTS